MIWLTWRQHRLEGLVTALVVVVVVGLVGALVLAMQPLLGQIRNACSSQGDACLLTVQSWDKQFATVHRFGEFALIALPLLPGLFIGAPLLARELEQGTHQLVWTQGISRQRWFSVKLGILGLAVLLLAGVLAVAGQEWSAARPTMSASKWHYFDVQGPEYVSYALFSLALGVSLGAVIGRTVPAMAAVMVGYVGARLAIAVLARPNFMPPLDWDFKHTSYASLGDIWILGSQRHTDLQGNPISDERFGQAMNSCVRLVNDPGPLGMCLNDHGVQVLQAYQPEYRFLLFQGIETAIFVIAAIALLLVSVWLVRRRA